MRRLLAVSHTADLGGAERGLAELLLALNGSGWGVTVVLPKAGPLAQLLRQKDISVHTVPFGWWASVETTRRSVAKAMALNALGVPVLAGLVRRLRPSTVLTSTIATPVGAMASWLARSKHVTYAQEFGLLDHRLFFHYGYERSMRMLSDLSAGWMANSACVARHFQSLTDRPTSVVPYSMALAAPRLQPLGPKPACLRLLLLGRFAPAKRQADAVAALAHLRRWGVPAELTLVGEGQAWYRAEVLGEAVRLGVVESVTQLGETRDVASHIDASHILLVPSEREAFGRVTIEAMRRTRLVVAADAGASPEIIDDGVTGLLHRVGYPEALALRLRDVWEYWPKAQSMAEAGYLHSVASFSPEQTARAFTAAMDGEGQWSG